MLLPVLLTVLPPRARTRAALCTVRCSQLGLPTDSPETTTCSRASNFRRRCEPPLDAGYVGNAVSQVWTELSVRDLLAMSVQDVALALRASLRALTPPTLAARARWLNQLHAAGDKARMRFDANALTFIVSSWQFEWERAHFGTPPVAFDHGALTPIVATFIPRARGGGVDVYASGPREACDHFVRLLSHLSLAHGERE